MPSLYQDKPDPYGFTPNPYGFGYRDLGLGTFLRSGFASGPNPNVTWRKLAPTIDAQMQVVTARNAALAPTQCSTTEAPGPYFQKEFFHNGYFKSLKQIVHFYNTRDVYPYPVTSGQCPAGTTEKVDCWPMPEVPNNIDMTTGSLGLTDEEENKIVAFLETLSDGFYQALSQPGYFHRCLHEGWLGCNPRQRVSNPDSASTKLRTRPSAVFRLYRTRRSHKTVLNLSPARPPSANQLME